MQFVETKERSSRSPRELLRFVRYISGPASCPFKPRCRTKRVISFNANDKDDVDEDDGKDCDDCDDGVASNNDTFQLSVKRRETISSRKQ
ncbi:hypothetical protein ACROYT_G039928 [Oculina patagonica]